MACVDVHIDQSKESCLSATIRRIDEGLDVNITNLSNGLSACSDVMSEGILANVRVISENISAQIKTIGSGLKARCSIICTLDKVADFLEVSPTEIQWITDDMGVYFDVKSNVEWIIITE